MTKPKPISSRRFMIRWLLGYLIVGALFAIPAYIATVMLDLFILLLHGGLAYAYPLFIFGVQQVNLRRWFGDESGGWRWFGLSSSGLWFLGFFLTTLTLSDQWDEPSQAMLAVVIMWSVPLLVQTLTLWRRYRSGLSWLLAGIIAAAIHGGIIASFFETLDDRFFENLLVIILGGVALQALVTGFAVTRMKNEAT